MNLMADPYDDIDDFVVFTTTSTGTYNQDS